MCNLWRSRQKWELLSRVLVRGVEDDQTLVINLCGGGPGGLVVWVGEVGDDTAHWGFFGRFHHRVVRSLTGRQHRRGVREGGGCIHVCQKQWRMWYYRKWRPIYTASRTQSNSSLQPCPLCRNLLSTNSRLNWIDPSTNIFPPNPERGYRTKFEILLEEVFPNSIE